MNIMDINKILALNIPDIHPTYGGVRGKTMSSCSQGYAWPIIKEAGVHTIIDLRNDGMNQRMQNLCKEYGMEYYLKGVTIPSLVRIYWRRTALSYLIMNTEMPLPECLVMRIGTGLLCSTNWHLVQTQPLWIRIIRPMLYVEV